MPFISLNGTPNVTLECLKRGEDDDEFDDNNVGNSGAKTAIIRLYESRGGRGDAKLTMYVKANSISIILCVMSVDKFPISTCD